LQTPNLLFRPLALQTRIVGGLVPDPEKQRKRGNKTGLKHYSFTEEIYGRQKNIVR